MLKQLNKDELKCFVNKYFKEWNDDIYKVTLMEHDDVLEYLVNDHYLFQVTK